MKAAEEHGDAGFRAEIRALVHPKLHDPWFRQVWLFLGAALPDKFLVSFINELCTGDDASGSRTCVAIVILREVHIGKDEAKGCGALLRQQV